MLFFDTFSQNDQTKCARPEALMDIRNTLAQEHYGTRLGSPLRGRTAPRVQSSYICHYHSFSFFAHQISQLLLVFEIEHICDS